MDDEGYGDILENTPGQLMELKNQDLIPLTPNVFSDFVCPVCQSDEVQATNLFFPGIHVLGAYNCASCNAEFERDLPIGFANDHPLAVDRSNKNFYNTTNAPDWLTGPFLSNYHNRTDENVSVERIVYKECDEVIILNCLDFLYGHVILKLYNAQHYLDNYPDKGLIIIAPKMYSWMIPEGIAEYWEVSMGIGKLQRWYNRFDEFVQEQLPRYKESFLGRGYSHPEFTKIDISRYIDVKPFLIERYTELPLHITFVSRQDRLWFRSIPAKFVYRVLRKLGLKDSFGYYYVRVQDRMMKQSMLRIRDEFPDATFSVVGLGKPVFESDLADDLRTMKMSREVELRWCEAYGKSHFVVGVHGSNMLLPTAFSAGCINILPRDKNGNIVQDVSVKYDNRLQLFLYRFVDEFASPDVVAGIATSMYKDYPVFYKNNLVNVF
jgi:hypothetical protein